VNSCFLSHAFPCFINGGFVIELARFRARTKTRNLISCVFSCSLLCWKARKHNIQKVKMHVIVLASQKGGAGKTTLAAHLAIAAEAAGIGRAVLIDTDPQGSLSAWWNVRESDSPSLAPTTIAELPEKLASLKGAGFAVAVIDTPPAITDAIRAVVALADLVLIPTRPSPHDLRAVGSTVEIIQAEDKPFIFVVTQAKPNTRLTVQVIAALSAHGAVAEAIVHDRVDYAGSMIDGRTVQETDAKGRSAAEMTALWHLVQERMAKSTKARKEDRNEQEARAVRRIGRR
jgi:chromosome partitioning protein